MINIYEYIINKNTKLVKNSDFKQFETKKEVCDFFDSKGFEKIESVDYDDYDNMISKISNSEKPIYCIGEFDKSFYNWWVRFGKGREDEYIFFWNVKGVTPNVYSIGNSHDEIIKKFKTFEEFKEYTIKYFNW